MDILLRNVSDEINSLLVGEAKKRGMTRGDLLLEILAQRYEPPVVVGWFRADRRGELDAEVQCPECGQPLAELWAGLLSNGQWGAPRCQWCATSE